MAQRLGVLALSLALSPAAIAAAPHTDGAGGGNAGSGGSNVDGLSTSTIQAAVATATAVSTSASGPASTPVYVDEPPWIASIFDYVNVGLKANPPAFPPSVARQEALMLLDGALHLEHANRFRSSHDFLVGRVTRAIEEIESTSVTSGARIWKIYNHGFVIRTPSVTIGVDLVRGWRFSEEPSQIYGVSDEWAARLVSQIDVLTLSHFHGDHCDPVIRDLAFAKGIPVIADESIYPEIAGQPLLIRPTRPSPEEAAGEGAGDTKDQKDAKDIGDTRGAWNSETLKRLGISIIAYPGHQGPVAINNCYLIRSSEGLAFLHTGDQSGDDDWPWIDRVGDRHKVDVLLVNCFTSSFDRVIRGVRPSLVVTGHENEMAHFPDHRETFWRSFQQFRGIESQPMAILCWGEGVVVPPR